VVDYSCAGEFGARYLRSRTMATSEVLLREGLRLAAASIAATEVVGLLSVSDYLHRKDEPVPHASLGYKACEHPP
jgi:hypothetical protein